MSPVAASPEMKRERRRELKARQLSAATSPGEDQERPVPQQGDQEEQHEAHDARHASTVDRATPLVALMQVELMLATARERAVGPAVDESAVTEESVRRLLAGEELELFARTWLPLADAAAYTALAAHLERVRDLLLPDTSFDLKGATRG